MVAKSPVVWILVSDHKKAKILINEGPNTGLKQVLIQDIESRIKQGAVRTRKEEKTGWWIFGGLFAKKTKRPKQSKVDDSALIDDVISLLNRAARRGHFDTFVMVGPKSTLSSIKENLNPAAKQRLHGELSKDLTTVSEYELEKYLSHIIRL